jgi:preprotein translocase subunit SecE
VAQAKSSQSNPTKAATSRESVRARGRGTTAASGGSAPPPAMPSGGGRRRSGNPFTSILHFIHDVRSELRKVAWPTQRETINLTVVVIALSVAMGLFLGGIDFIFQELFRFLLGITGGSA